ncbi:MAG: endonuclease domain-containing protein [Nitrospirae bacterium]|nr:endonuclease domain-containing protein [Nitrospirota bacterium]
MKHLLNTPELKQRRKELRNNPTEAEKAFWSQVRYSRFKGLKFVRQYSVGPYILDFYCPSSKLAVELDGEHHGNADGRAYDTERSAYLQVKGIRVVRFWNHEVLADMQGVLRKLAEYTNP